MTAKAATAKRPAAPGAGEQAALAVEALQASVLELATELATIRESGAFPPVVVHDSSEPATPFSLLLGQLLEEGLDREPWRRGTAARMRGAVTVVEEEAEAASTLLFGGWSVLVRNGERPEAHLRIQGRMDDINAAILVKPPGGLLTRDGLALMRALVSRRLRVQGMFRHPVLLLHLMRLLHVGA